MSRALLFRRAAALIVIAALSCGAPLRALEQKFTTSNTLSSEAVTLLRLLEDDHFNREAVHQSDFGDVVPDYMTVLDGWHLFFLKTDKSDFMQKWDAKTLYANVAYLGNIDPAYEIYYVYRQRVEARVNWIFHALQQDFDLTDNETFAADRTKAEWPATAAASDDLWRQRLKFELIAELLAKKTLPQAKEIIRKRYAGMLKNLNDFDGPDLAERYLSTITALYDPHSDYMSAESFEDFGIQMKLELVGIGAMLEKKEDYCEVKELVPGGPADVGHQLKPNDKIIAVGQDGNEPVEIIGMKLTKVVEMIRGHKGSQVHLLVIPADATDPTTRKEIIITRDVVKLSSARAHGAIFQVPAGAGRTVPLGVISLPEFYGPADDAKPGEEKISASGDVGKLISEMKQAGVRGLVLDLRHNGGGYLGEAINLAGLFIPPGPVVQVKDIEGHKTVDNSDNATVAYDGPLAVLEDRFSASASEIVIGALQNYGRAIVVGDSSTHGKGTVQIVVEMKNLTKQLAATTEKTGAAKITIQKFYLPNGSSTQLKGVVPDIILPSIDDYLPIGESSLPHALIWDRIDSSFFEGAPLDAKVLAPLRQDSQERQSHLEEFSYLRQNMDWFKARQDEKLISLNLEDRRKQKVEDDAFKKQMDAEHDKLAKEDYGYKEFRLGPPPAPKVKPIKKQADDDDDEDVLSTDDNEPYAKVDVPLRETLRVLDDAIDLGRDHQYWASDHAPLTITSKG
jgi:carboxyl-terminal processing protease